MLRLRVLVAAALLVASASPVEPAQRLVPLAQPGPWSGVSGLIGYGERLWFVNSVKFVDHNSADVYSYDPRRGTTRYEAHLFSQDAGDPAVAGGLLYWPFEDPRFSAGRGEYMVTDGRAWQWRVLPEGEVFHVHAMTAHRGALYAATSAWRAGLQRSDDGGATWRIVYEHPGPPRSITRITTLAVNGDVLYAGLTASEDGVKLLGMHERRLRPVHGWPKGVTVDVLASHRGWLYGVNVDDHSRSLWRTDGHAVERISALSHVRVRGLASGGDVLWAVTAREGSGALWRSDDGATWAVEQRFADAEPLSVVTYGRGVYVGTRGPRDRGTLWGPPPPAGVEADSRSRSLPSHALRDDRRAVGTMLPILDRALASHGSYVVHAAGLLDALRPLAFTGGSTTGAELAVRLRSSLPDSPVTLFGGALTLPAAVVARWYLLWAMGLAGGGRIPVELLESAWTAPRNRAEKYLEPAPAAAWVAARLGQADDGTIGALIASLGVPGRPSWLDGDLVGALTTLTGERFGHDVSAWRQWWTARRRSSR